MKKKKKNNENEKNNLAELARWTPARQMDVRTYLGRTGTVRGLASLITALETEQPEVKVELVKVALEQMLEVRDAANAVIAHEDKVEARATVLVSRNAFLVATTGVMGVLDALVGGASEGLTARAAAVQTEVFGARKDLARLRPREVWHVGDAVRETLAAQPELRERLEELVQPEMVAQLLRANRALGEAMGITKKRGAQSMDQRTLAVVMNQHVDRYALCVMATANPRQPETVLRAEAALRPILELREENARRRERNAGGDVVEEEDDPPEVTMPEVTTPAATTSVVAVPVGTTSVATTPVATTPVATPTSPAASPAPAIAGGGG